MSQLKSKFSCLYFFIFLIFTFQINVINAQNIWDFTSIPAGAKTGFVKMPNTHDFQYLVRSGNGIPDKFDFTAFVPLNNSSQNGYLSINHEIENGGVTLFDITRNVTTNEWSLSDQFPIRYGEVDRPCSGLVTSWGTVLSCEEWGQGEVLETDPVAGTSVWRYQLGRFIHENVAENLDNNRTFYTGEDKRPDGYLLKFVADQAQDLSSGNLYAFKRNGSSGTWISIPNGPEDDAHQSAADVGATPFDGIEDVEISPIDGKVYFATKGDGNIYRFNELNPLGGGTVAGFEIYVAGQTNYNTGNGTANFGTGTDNLAFDEVGNLWALQDNNDVSDYIWMIEVGHTAANPSVKLFGQAPAGAEPTGITFTPDNKYLFMSIMHPSGNNSSSQADVFNQFVPNNNDFAIAIARNETWSTPTCTTNSNSIGLQNYVNTAFFEEITEVNELSGITFHPNGSLFAVDDERDKILRMSTTGLVTGEIDLSSSFQDTEGIVHIQGNEFALIEERRRRIAFVNFNVSNLPSSLAYPSASNRIDIRIGHDDDTGVLNEGLEGAAYNPSNKTIYVAKQLNNKNIFAYRIGEQRSGAVAPEKINIENISSQALNGLHFTSEGNLLVLATNSTSGGSTNKTLWELDLCDGSILSSKNMNNNLPNAPDGTTVSTERFEGVTVDAQGNIYMVADRSPSWLYKMTKNAACLKPTGLTETSISATAASLKWNPVAGAVSYKVQYKKASDPLWTTSTEGTILTTRNISSLSPSTQYQWRVKANCTNGTSNYEINGFVTSSNCNAPTGLTTTNITSSGASLSWSAVSGAQSYRVDYKRSNSTNWTTHLTSTSATSATLVNLLSNTSYDWRVRSNCAAGQISNFIEGGFTTANPPPCPVPTGLTLVSVTTTSAQVSWTDVAGALNYKVDYKKNTDSNWTTSTNGTSSTFRLFSGLSAGTNYQWRVRSNCAGGQTSTFALGSFTTTAICVAPSNLSMASITTNSVLLNWLSSSNAQSYRIEYKRSNVATWTLLEANHPTSSISLTGLLSSTSYNWRVRSNCAGGQTSAFIQQTFTTLGVCNAPTNLSASNPSSSSITLSWAAVAGGSSYTLEYRPTSVATWTTAFNTQPITTITINNLNSGNSYFWRIKTHCSGGQISGFALGSFNTLPACQSPTGLSETAVNTTSVSLQWNAVPGALSYRVEYKVAISNTWIISTFGTGLTSRTINSLSPGTSYNWRIRTNCSGGETSAYANDGFTTATQCDPPSGLNATNITSSSAIVRWTSSSSALTYRVEYKKATDNNWIVSAFGTSGNARQINNLETGTTYDYRIRSTCIGNAQSIFVQEDFTTQSNCGSPTNLTNTNITLSSATLSWAAAPNANGYRIEYRLLSNSNWVLRASNHTGTSIGLSNLSPGTTYVWRVRANCSGSSSIWIHSNFQTLASCNTPSNTSESNLNYTSARMNWFASSGAINYTVEYRELGATTWINTGTYSVTYRNIIGLLAGTTYQWRVRANCSGNTFSSWANDSFTTPGSCEAPTGTNETELSSSSVRVNWNSMPNASAYRVEYKLSTSTTWVISTTSTTATSKVISGLNAGANYDWRVRSHCYSGAVASPYTIDNFTTQNINAICESFESGIGMFTQATNDDINWTRQSGPTPSTLTGPSAAFDGNWYMFVESSAPNNPDKLAIIRSPNFKVNSSQSTMTVNYSMFGSAMGNMRIIVRNLDTGVFFTVLNVSGDQGSAWKSFSYNTGNSNLLNRNIRVEFIFETGLSWRSDGAIDNFCISGVTQNLEGTLSDREDDFEEFTKVKSWSIYPNPASDVLFVEWVNEIDETNLIQIFDSSGKLVFAKQIAKKIGTREQEISLASFEKGLYYLSLSQHDGLLTKRFIVQ